jgi:hypothetical protein
VEGGFVEAGLRALEERGLVYRERVIPDEEYAFRHVLAQEAVYASLAPSRRRALHRAAGEALEALHGADLTPWHELLAFHFERSSDHAKAVTYLLLAGEASRRAFLNAEAFAYLRRALARLGRLQATAASDAHGDTERRIREHRGDLLELRGEHEAARQEYEQALACCGAEASLARVSQHRKIGVTWQAERRLEEALAAYRAAEAALSPRPVEPSPEWWHAAIDLEQDWITTLYWMPKLSEMEERVRRVRPIVEDHGTASQRARFFTRVGGMVMLRDGFQVSEELWIYLRLAQAAAREAGDPAEIACAEFSAGLSHYLADDLPAAEPPLRIALTLQRKLGDRWSEAVCLHYLATLHRRLGSVEASRQHATLALEAALEAQAALYEGTARANLAWVAWRQGDTAVAREGCLAALALWQRTPGMKGSTWTALWPLLAIDLEAGDLAKARNWAGALLQMEPFRVPPELRRHLEAALSNADDDPEAVRASLERALEGARSAGFL